MELRLLRGLRGIPAGGGPGGASAEGMPAEGMPEERLNIYDAGYEAFTSGKAKELFHAFNQWVGPLF